MTIRAIETRYKGYRFRSRLEARWAVFFDALGVKWEYEKEGYDLGEAGWYLPDFWLTDFGTFAEIKPSRNEAQEHFDKFKMLSEVAPMIVLTDIQKPDPLICSHCGFLFQRYALVPVVRVYGFRWAYTDHTIGVINDHESLYLWRGSDAIFQVATERTDVTEAQFVALMQSAKVQDAFTLANGSRFEHGETPQVQP